MLSFHDSARFASPDSDQMLFGPLDFEDYSTTSPVVPWDMFNEMESDVKPLFDYPPPSSLPSHYDYDISQSSPTESYYGSAGSYDVKVVKGSPPVDNNDFLANWINDPDLSLPASPTSPIPIPSSLDIPPASSFISFSEQNHFPQGSMLSPADYAALHPLPRSMSPSSSFEDRYPAERQRVHSISPQDTSLHTPSWAAQLWDTPSSLRSPSSPRSVVRHSPMHDATLRQRVPVQRGSISTGQLFQSSSAPSPTMTRAYSRRAESVSVTDDHDATVRRKKRSPPAEDPNGTVKAVDNPLKSVLRPPKLAPSAWQLYFTDWIQKQQASGTRKLNVAQAAKEAGQEYACLSNEEKEPYKRRSLAAKEVRERELAAYMRTLTPDDIKRENAFRAAQRKAGKSRKSNIKDPNAPKKPLSAYFMFLQRIRANPQLVRDIFGDETETTKQSVLAAAKWRSMTDAERQPFLAQAEQEKMEYEAARRIYEEGAASYGSSNINFSILPGSPSFPTMRMESESETLDYLAYVLGMICHDY
ncbi:hypothetical protein BDZ94DRAFT_1281765 [Collybia nuda]|uniref:HMG box domain-containing protein n=1 Tax=Collybia nuda TaxID=64659 RepID=A0A9P5YAK7_9AGAR|nr:hypothetical protein BDZ94DRAFT_1281765 [Collybia nuda]